MSREIVWSCEDLSLGLSRRAAARSGRISAFVRELRVAGMAVMLITHNLAHPRGGDGAIDRTCLRLARRGRVTLEAGSGYRGGPIPAPTF